MTINVQVSKQYQGVIEDAGNPQNSGNSNPITPVKSLSDILANSTGFYSTPDGIMHSYVNGVEVGDSSNKTLRNVGIRCGLVNGGFGSPTALSFMSRSIIKTAVELKSIKLVIANVGIIFTAGNTIESQAGAASPMTFNVSVEYPLGTTPVLITAGGATTFTVGATTFIETDEITLPVKIPAGASFRFAVRGQSASGSLMGRSSTVGTNTGDEWNFSSGIIGDNTGNLTGVGNPYNNFYPPAAVLASSAKPSIFMLMDSQGCGNNLSSDITDSSLLVGLLSRAIGPYLPYCNSSTPSDRAYLFAAGNNQNRIALANKYHTHIICNFGINDIVAGRTLAQLKSDTITNASKFTIPYYACTLPPSLAKSTNGFADIAGQTITGGDIAFEATRVSFNQWLRDGGIPGISGIFDLASIVEDKLNPGKWLPALASGLGGITGNTITLASVTTGNFSIGQHIIANNAAIGKIISGSGLVWTLDQNNVGVISAGSIISASYTSDGVHTTGNANLLFYNNAVLPIGLFK